jgi:hypothetical protein
MDRQPEEKIIASGGRGGQSCSRMAAEMMDVGAGIPESLIDAFVYVRDPGASPPALAPQQVENQERDRHATGDRPPHFSEGPCRRLDDTRPGEHSLHQSGVALVSDDASIAPIDDGIQDANVLIAVARRKCGIVQRDRRLKWSKRRPCIFQKHCRAENEAVRSRLLFAGIQLRPLDGASAVQADQGC